MRSGASPVGFRLVRNVYLLGMLRTASWLGRRGLEWRVMVQVHISFVRSVQMDSWTEKEIKAMQVGGNKQMNDFLASHGVSKKSPIKKKYNSSAAALYREMCVRSLLFTRSISAKIEGREPPTALPESPVDSNSENE